VSSAGKENIRNADNRYILSVYMHYILCKN